MRFGLVQKTSRLEPFENALHNRCVFNKARSDPIATIDDLITANLYQCDRLSIAWLETYRSSSGDVESVAVGANAVELQLRVRFDEVVVRANLSDIR